MPEAKICTWYAKRCLTVSQVMLWVPLHHPIDYQSYRAQHPKLRSRHHRLHHRHTHRTTTAVVVILRMLRMLLVVRGLLELVPVEEVQLHHRLLLPRRYPPSDFPLELLSELLVLPSLLDTLYDTSVLL